MTHGIKAKDIRDFEKCARKMNTILRRIAEYNPDVLLYVSGESTTSFNLHGFQEWKPDYIGGLTQNGVVTSVDVEYCDCGGY